MIIKEQSNFRLFWDTLIAILVVVSCVWIPYQVAFVHSVDADYSVPMMCVSFIFLVDIGFNFITSYRMGGIEVVQQKAIKQGYLRGMFTIDVLANVPVFLALVVVDQAESSVINTVLVIQLLGVLRLVRLFNILQRWESFVWIQPGYLRVTKYVVTTLILTHCIACLWFVVPYSENFPANSWVVSLGIQNSDASIQYTRSLYWAITTMTTVGYGDITPGSTSEYLLASLTMLIGASLYAVIIGGVASLLSGIQAIKNNHWSHMVSVEQYLKARRVPNEITSKVHNYYEYLWHRQKGLNEDQLLRELPEPLQLEIMLHLAEGILKKVPIFKHCSDALRDALLGALKPVTYAPDDYLIRTGDLARNIIFITCGQVSISIDDEGDNLETYKEGDYFGYLSLVLNEPRVGFVRAKDYCEVLILDKNSYEKIGREYPEFKIIMKKISADKSKVASELFLQGVVI